MSTIWMFLVVIFPMLDAEPTSIVDFSGVFETEKDCRDALGHNRPLLIEKHGKQAIIFADCQPVPDEMFEEVPNNVG